MRFALYQQIGSRLNEIYCYFSYVGKWKDLSPSRIIENKRVCDEYMYSNQSLFNQEFFGAYNAFMDVAYKTYSTEGQDAKLLTDLGTHKKYYTGSMPWQNKWDDMFGIDPSINEFDIRKDINDKYNTLLTLLSRELNIKEVTIKNEFKDLKPE